MKLISNQFWSENQTNLSKYFVELLLQKVDSQELISYQHSTSNGHTIIAELLKQSNTTLQREKSGHRLTSLILEAVDINSKSSVIGDPIIKKFHRDIIDFFNKYSVAVRSVKERYEITNVKHSDAAKQLLIKRERLINFRNKMEVFNSRLDNYYLHNLKQFARNEIDLSDDSKFQRNANKVNVLVQYLIPSLLKIGYSPTSIRDVVVYVLPSQNSNNVIEKFLNIFHGGFSEVDFELTFEKDHQLSDFYTYFANSKPTFEKIELENEKYDTYRLDKLSIVDRNTFITSHFLTIYKEFVVRHHGKLSDLNYSDFFDRIASRTSPRNDVEDEKRFDKTLSKDSIDPLNVTARKSTLINTVNEIYGSEEIHTVSDPRLAELLYNYSLALSTQSIEVSMSVLWTILESLTTYRYRSSDIANVQYFVSKFLSIGAIGRDIRSFASRLFVNNSLNKGKIGTLPVYKFGALQSTYGLENWAKYLSQSFPTKDDPYKDLNRVSPLLCKMFCDLNDSYKDDKLSVWLDRILDSKTSVEFQLERIYSYRNQVVHAGKTVSEYSNLWTHLEWYVGKLLSYLYVSCIDNPRVFGITQSFKQLEGDCDYVLNFLDENRESKIADNEDFLSSLFKHSWVTY